MATNAKPTNAARPRKRRVDSPTDAAMAEALTKTGGRVYKAAALLGCNPSTIYSRMASNPDIAAICEYADGALVDAAEDALLASVREREAWAVCFTLKTKGKRRGYVERQEHEISGPGGGAVQIDVASWRRDLGLDGGGDAG